MTFQDIKAVLFDLDGTLIDSENFYFSNWAPILAEEFDVHITFGDWIEHFAGHTLARNVAFLKEKYGVQTTEEFMFRSTRANYAKADMSKIGLMPYAKEILEELKAKGIRIALVTSSYRSTVDAVLGHHGLLDYFEFFVTRDVVENPKPNAEPYLQGIEKLGLDKQHVLAIEDTITGFSAASAAGLTCLAISKHKTEREKLAGAEYLFESLDMLKDLIY